MLVRTVCFLALWFMIGLAFLGLALAQPKVDDADFSSELPRIPATEPGQARATMTIQKGFDMDLVAHEPLVASPVALAWDEQARLFIVEMRGYSEHRDENLSRIRLLTDKDNDGKYDEATVYVDKLLWPTAVCCWDGGIFVGDAPDIWYCKDTNNDGVADIKRKVFTGFSVSNVQGLFNSFTWGLDNRIHGAGSSTGGSIQRVENLDGTPATQGPPVVINGRDFSFDPVTLDFRTETGGAQHGMTFDDWGNKYVCHNSDHAIRCVIDDAYLARNPLFAAPPAKVSIAVDGPQATIFRSSPVEPWRIVRTRLRASGAVPGILEGGGRAAGYFTSATGITSIRGDAFAVDVRGTLVVGDVGSNVIHRKRVIQKGNEQTAERIDVESEFVASTDIWFRPAQFANGPDGGLYVADVYREVIEHPASLPPVIKRHLDLDSGRDRGRVWRIRPESFDRKRVPNLGSATNEELVTALKHENAWHRETASRLLYQRQTIEVAPALRKQMADRLANPVGRMQAAYTLQGLKQLRAADLDPLFESQEPMLRKHAVKLAESFSPDDAASLATLGKRLTGLAATEPDQRVRFQVALALGAKPYRSLRSPDGLVPLVGILARDGDNAWARTACFTSLPENLGDLFRSIAEHRETALTPAMKSSLPQLAAIAARDFARIDSSKIPESLQAICQGDPALSRRVLIEFTSTLARSGKQLDPKVDRASWNAFVAATVDESLRTARDSQADPAARAEAIRGLVLAPYASSGETLKALIVPTEPGAVVLAAISALDSYNDSEVGTTILSAWPSLSPEARRRGGEVLLARPERVDSLLKALEEKTLSVAELDRAQLETLKKHANEGLRQRAEKLLASASEPRRADVVEKYKPALTSEGDLARGKAAFAKNCAACHKVEGVGNEIGPNLAAMKNRGVEAILVNVLDPNREVNPQYLAYSATTQDGRTRSGLIAAESAASITLRKVDGQPETILRADLEELRSTGLSLMPEGLEKQIDPQTMADLLVYLMKAN